MPEFNEQEFINVINNYEASEYARELVDAVPPTLLVGITGAGKDSTKNELLKSHDFSEIVSHTTRKPRINNGEREQDGVHYHFVSPAEMYDLASAHKFIEIKHVHGSEGLVGDVYGTSVAELEKARSLGTIAVTDIDVQGVREYKNLSHKTVAIFILPPDYETWRERLAKRYESQSAFDAEWPKRSRSAIAELNEALSVPYYHFIINREIEHTAKVAGEIARRGDVFKRADDEARLAARDLLESILAQR